MLPIIDVSSWLVVKDETSGANEKSWLRDPCVPNLPANRWVFKPVTVHDDGSVQGGDWAERLACEVASRLGVSSAEIEMAVREGTFGTLSRNVRPNDEWEIWEGALWLDADPSAEYSLTGGRTSRRVRGASAGHSLPELRRALQLIGPPPGMTSTAEDGWDAFAWMMTLDALVANRDRHEHNWSVLRPSLGSGQPCLASAYDNEGAFGFNLTDDLRARLLGNRAALDRWIVGGTAWRYWWTGDKVPTLVEAARIACEGASDSTRMGLMQALSEFDVESVDMQVVPRMSDVARNFSRTLLSTNLERLQNELRDIVS